MIQKEVKRMNIPGKWFILLRLSLTLAVLTGSCTYSTGTTIDVLCDSQALINAIDQANSYPSPSTINLTANCTYAFTEIYDDSSDPDFYYTGDNALPVVYTEITINGNGATLLRNPPNNHPRFRFIFIQSEGILNLDNLNLSGGYIHAYLTANRFVKDGGALFNQGTLNITNSSFDDNSSQDGGAIFNESSSVLYVDETQFINNRAALYGGAISNLGEATINNSSFTDNEAWGSQAPMTLSGGAISNYSIMTIENTSFNNNSAYRRGGALHNQSNGVLTVSKCTFNQNQTQTSAGGAVYNEGSLDIINSTFSANTTHGSGTGTAIFNGGILSMAFTTIAYNTNSEALAASPGASTNITNSIIANNPAGDCDLQNATTSGSANLDTDGSCPNFTITEDPLLGSLADNGGSTLTHALPSNSPAIDAALGTFPNNDQRFMLRPQGDYPDLGAYEKRYLQTVSVPNIIIFRVNVNCRIGPHYDHVVVLTYQEGDTASAIGRNRDGSWLAVLTPSSEDEDGEEEAWCWVPDEWTTRDFDLLTLPELDHLPDPALLIDPSEDIPPDEPQACHAGLNQTACIAAGGKWNISTTSCDCPP